MAIQGLRHTNTVVQDGRPKNWRAGILMAYPNGDMPLTGLTSLFKSESTDDPEYNWWEKEMQDRRVKMTANLTVGSTDLTVEMGAFAFKAGDVLMSEHTLERMIVIADPVMDTKLQVVRGFANSTAAIVTIATQNPYVICIGSAYEEGSDAPSAVDFDPTKHNNFTQIFRNSFESTRTFRKTKLRYGDQVKEMKRECLELHGVDMERAFIFGGKSESSYKGKPRRTTGGILSFIPQANQVDMATDYSTGLTMDGLDELMYNVFKKGSSEKMVLCGNRAALTLQQVVRKNTHMQIQSGIKEYGMNVSRLSCQFGELVIKTHPLFNQMSGGAGYTGFESSAMILDMAEFKYRYVDDTAYQAKQNADGVDGEKSGYLTEAGLEVHHPSYHHLWRNLTKAAVDQ